MQRKIDRACQIPTSF